MPQALADEILVYEQLCTHNIGTWLAGTHRWQSERGVSPRPARRSRSRQKILDEERRRRIRRTRIAERDPRSLSGSK